VSFVRGQNLLCVPLFALLILLSACKGKAKEPVAGQVPEVPRPQESWSQEPVSVPPQQVAAVKQGSAPLLYMVESAAVVRVADLTSGQDLLRMPVTARTVVAVDSSAGVRVGSATMKLGPLPAGHVYGIFLESAETNVLRRGSIRPGQPGQAAPVTQPRSLP
jgi:hypothetical protein